MLTKKFRLHRSDYNKILSNRSQNKAIYSPFYTIVYIRTNKKETKIGIIASTKVGNAVSRNRAKRLIRGFINNNKDILPLYTKMVIITTRKLLEAQPKQIYKSLKKDLKRIVKKS